MRLTGDGLQNQPHALLHRVEIRRLGRSCYRSDEIAPVLCGFCLVDRRWVLLSNSHCRSAVGPTEVQRLQKCRCVTLLGWYWPPDPPKPEEFRRSLKFYRCSKMRASENQVSLVVVGLLDRQQLLVSEKNVLPVPNKIVFLTKAIINTVCYKSNKQ